MTADATRITPGAGAGAGESINSPRKSKNLSSPWAKVVRGESESIPTVNHSSSPRPSSEQPCSPSKAALSSRPASSEQLSSLPSKATVSSRLAADNCFGTESMEGNAGKTKKAAWNKPSNDVAEVSPVMGAISWPALSESTKASPKSSSADQSSLKIVSDGSMPSSQGPVIPHSPHKQATSNAKSNSTPNHTMPTRQRSMKRGGGVGGSNPGVGLSQNSFTHPSPPPPPPPPPYPGFAVPPNGYSNLVPAMPDQSPRETPNRGNNWEPRAVGGFVVNDHRHSSRRANFGPRGDGPYHNNFGGRRDQDRGHYGNARDVHVPPQRAPPRSFVRPPPLNTTFVPPQPVRPFPNPMGLHDVYYVGGLPLEHFRPVPFITHAPGPAMLMHAFPDPTLPAMLLHQIEYYFSDANLIKDNFLKLHMDDQGWVSIALIAGFNRVKSMTSDIQLILESLRASTVLEVQGDRIRRRDEWVRWIPSSNRLPTESGLQSSSVASYDMLTTSFQKITMKETSANQNGMTVESSPNSEDVPRRHSPELTAQAQISCQEATEDTRSN